MAKSKSTPRRSPRPRRRSEAEMNRIIQGVMAAQQVGAEVRMVHQAHAANIASATYERRWGGIRSLAILAALSSVMFGLLIAGALAH